MNHKQSISFFHCLCLLILGVHILYSSQPGQILKRSSPGQRYLPVLIELLKLLKIFISIKLCWVTSNGERFVVYNIMRNGSLWSDIVFEKEVIFHEFHFETSDLEFEVSKHTTSWQGCFFFHNYLATSTTNWAQIFTGLSYMHTVITLVFDNITYSFQKAFYTTV